MAGSQEIPKNTRTFLKTEMSAWVAEGIVTEDGARVLKERYRLDAPERDSGKMLSMVIQSAAALLLGLGVCALVAANWQIIPAWLKIAVLYILLVGCHFQAWRCLHTPGRERIGHGLSLLGCIIFGAGIALMAQIFHITSENNIVYAWWAAGSLAVAWALPSAIVGYLALGASICWFLGDRWYPAGTTELLLLNYYPLIIACAFLPLAIVGKSRRLFIVTLAVIIGASTLSGGMMDGGSTSKFGLLGMLAAVLFAWGGGQYLAFIPKTRDYSKLACAAGVGGLGGAIYVWSLHDMWAHHMAGKQIDGLANWLTPLIIMALAGLAALIYAWRRTPPGTHERYKHFAVLGPIVLLAAAALSATVGANELRIIGPLTGNIAALVLIVGALVSGVNEARRSNFWLGTLFLILIIFTRFFEYDTDLITKAMVFIACGVITLLAGIEYERYLKRGETPRE